MRFVSIPLFLIATALSAATFGPELPFTPPAPDGSGQELPHVSMTTRGPIALWNGGATFTGMTAAQQPIAASAAVNLDPIVHRDGAVASIGDQSLAAWIEEDWLYSRRIAADGTPIGSNVLLQQVDSRHTMRMAVGASNSEYIVVWPQLSRILATTLDSQGNSINWQAQATGGTYGRNIEKVAVTSNGSEFLVVWEATSDEPWFNPCSMGCPSTDRDIHAVIVGPDGNPLTQTETLLAKSAGMPDVTWTGSDYLVVWSTLPNGGIAGRHIASGFASMGPVQTFTTEADFGPVIASDASSPIVAFARAGQTAQDPAALLALRINPDGSVSPLTAAPMVLGTSPRQFAIAASGSTVAIAYTNAGHINVRYLGAGIVPPGRSRSVHH